MITFPSNSIQNNELTQQSLQTTVEPRANDRIRALSSPLFFNIMRCLDIDSLFFLAMTSKRNFCAILQTNNDKGPFQYFKNFVKIAIAWKQAFQNPEVLKLGVVDWNRFQFGKLHIIGNSLMSPMVPLTKLHFNVVELDLTTGKRTEDTNYEYVIQNGSWSLSLFTYALRNDEQTVTLPKEKIHDKIGKMHYENTWLLSAQGEVFAIKEKQAEIFQVTPNSVIALPNPEFKGVRMTKINKARLIDGIIYVEGKYDKLLNKQIAGIFYYNIETQKWGKLLLPKGINSVRLEAQYNRVFVTVSARRGRKFGVERQKTISYRKNENGEPEKIWSYNHSSDTVGYFRSNNDDSIGNHSFIFFHFVTPRIMALSHSVFGEMLLKLCFNKISTTVEHAFSDNEMYIIDPTRGKENSIIKISPQKHLELLEQRIKKFADILISQK